MFPTIILNKMNAIRFNDSLSYSELAYSGTTFSECLINNNQ